MTEQNNTFGATTDAGLIEVILCWTLNGEEDFMSCVAKAVELVAEEIYNLGERDDYNGEVMSQLFVYRNPNGSYTVFVDDEDEAVGHFDY